MHLRFLVRKVLVMRNIKLPHEFKLQNLSSRFAYGANYMYVSFVFSNGCCIFDLKCMGIV